MPVTTRVPAAVRPGVAGTGAQAGPQPLAQLLDTGQVVRAQGGRRHRRICSDHRLVNAMAQLLGLAGFGRAVPPGLARMRLECRVHQILKNRSSSGAAA
jgi:hypothetical protein